MKVISLLFLLSRLIGASFLQDGSYSTKDLKAAYVHNKCQLVGQSRPYSQYEQHGRDVTVYINKGSRAETGSYPWQASIQVSTDGGWGHVCSGALVSTNKVLTAAHCITGFSKSYSHRIALNWHDFTQPENSTGIQIIVVSKVEKPKAFYKKTKKGSVTRLADLAVLTLETNAELTKDVNTLPIRHSSDVHSGLRCTIAGWGWPKVDVQEGSPYLLEGYVSVITNELAQKFWMVIRRATNLRPRVHHTHVCALDYPGLHSGCEGDGGTPLVCNGDLVGVLSWGQRECNGCIPQCYTRVSSFSAWLNKTLG